MPILNEQQQNNYCSVDLSRQFSAMSVQSSTHFLLCYNWNIQRSEISRDNFNH